MGFEIRHSQVLCAPQYASALANAMRQFGLDGLLVSYSTLACGFAPTRAIALTAEQAIELHNSFQPPRCPESLCCTKRPARGLVGVAQDAFDQQRSARGAKPSSPVVGRRPLHSLLVYRSFGRLWRRDDQQDVARRVAAPVQGNAARASPANRIIRVQRSLRRLRQRRNGSELRTTTKSWEPSYVLRGRQFSLWP